MRDEIFYGNLLGLLKSGKWSLSITEASALLQIYQEAERRLKPQPVVPKKSRKKIEGSNGH